MEILNVNELLRSLFNEDKGLNIKDLFEQKLLEYDLSKTKAFKLLSIDKDVFEEICNGTAKQPNLINIVKLAEFLESVLIKSRFRSRFLLFPLKP